MQLGNLDLTIDHILTKIVLIVNLEWYHSNLNGLLSFDHVPFWMSRALLEFKCLYHMSTFSFEVQEKDTGQQQEILRAVVNNSQKFENK